MKGKQNRDLARLRKRLKTIADRRGMLINWHADLPLHVLGVADYYGPGIILVNRLQGPREKLVTAAHELGHHQLHRRTTSDTGKAYRQIPAVRERREQEADRFAGKLLAMLSRKAG